MLPYNHDADNGRWRWRPTRNGSPSHELDAPPWLRVEMTLIGAATRDPRSLRRAAGAARADAQPRQPARLRRRVRAGQPDARRRAPRPGARRHRRPGRPARAARPCRAPARPRRPSGVDGRDHAVRACARRPRSPRSTACCAPSCGPASAAPNDSSWPLFSYGCNATSRERSRARARPPPNPQGARHDRRSDRRRDPHARRQAQRQVEGLAPGRSRRPRAEGAAGAQRSRPGARRRRRDGVRDAGRAAVAQHRSQRGARRRVARVGAGDDGRPPVRVEPAGAALRRPGCDRRARTTSWSRRASR